MKTLVKVFLLFITSTLLAQNTIEKSVGTFSELKVYDLIAVELVKSTDNKVIITGNNKEDVVFINKNGTLKIKMSFNKLFDGNNTKVILHYSALDIIDVNEGAQVTGTDVIKQFEIDLRAQEGGSIKIPVQTNYINVKAVTGGFIEAIGEAKTQKIALLTGGIYKGENLETLKTDVSINAAGEAYIKASKLVDIKIIAGGDVFLYGNPETVNESKMLGGRIKRMD